MLTAIIIHGSTKLVVLYRRHLAGAAAPKRGE